MSQKKEIVKTENLNHKSFHLDQLIRELTLIRPVLSNTYQEIFDYIDSFQGLNYLQWINEHKQIPSERNFNLTKELIERNRHYLAVIVSDRTQLVQQRKTEGEVSKILVRLYDLLPKLIQKNHTVGIDVIGQHIDVDTRLLNVLHRNLTYNAVQVRSLLDRANEAIEYYSKQIRLN